MNRHHTPQLEKYKLDIGYRWAWRSRGGRGHVLGRTCVHASAHGGDVGDWTSLSTSS